MTRPARPWIVGLLMALAMSACGGEDGVGPASRGVLGVDLVLFGSVVTVDRGGTVELSARITDGDNRLVDPATVDLVWETRDPGVATVSAGGELRGGPGLGATHVLVRAPGGAADSALVWVQPAAADPAGFRITLFYADDVPDGWRTALASAAARWEEVIRAELPPVALEGDVGACQAIPTGTVGGLPDALDGVERGVRIFVDVSNGFPEGTYVEAVGGPCVQRPLPVPTTVLGIIRLNPDHPVKGIEADRLRYLAVHEMGHALGLVGVVQGFPPDWFDPEALVYAGRLAIEGHRMDTGAFVNRLRVTGGSHWDLEGDVMAARGEWERISHVSVGALMDLGYPAAWYGAGPLVP